MKYVSYWQDTAPTFDLATAGPVSGSYDVAVIGGGFTGLGAARRLAQEGKSVVVLEAETVGFGASGRNGGHLNNGIAHSYGHARETFGEKPVGQRASTEAMYKHVKTDKKYQEQRMRSRYDLAAMFKDADVSEDKEDPMAESGYSGASGAGPTETPNKSEKMKDKKNPKAETWFGEELEVNNNGDIIAHIYNVAAIVYNDPEFYAKICFDEFSGSVRLSGDIKSKTDNVPDLICQDKIDGDRWQDLGYTIIRATLATPSGPGKVGYGLKTITDRDLIDSVLIAAQRNKYHPIKDFLATEPWDGTKRLDNLFIDYLGLTDTPYARETARLTMIASVARIFEPGHKFDNGPVLQGRQGIRKSTFISTLYTSRWFGELACDLNEQQRVAEGLQGKWGVELPELTALNKSETAEIKAFMSRQEDNVRMAYHRTVSIMRRKAVMWGTTNDEIYFKDRTGNRRFWPLVISLPEIDTTALAVARQQLWAEALNAYQQMRTIYPKAHYQDLPLMLSTEAESEAVRLQEGARERGVDEDWTLEISGYLDHPIRLTEFARNYGVNPAEFVKAGESAEKTWVVRQVFRTADAATAVGLDWPLHVGYTVSAINRAVKNVPGWIPDRKGTRYRRWGSRPTGWHRRKDASEEDVARGFKVVPAPETVEAGFYENHGFTEEDLGSADDDENIDNLV